MYFPEKPEILKGRGFHDYGILRAWGGGGGTHFGISEGKGGLKHGSRPLGMDIFWNCPIEKAVVDMSGMTSDLMWFDKFEMEKCKISR